MQRQEQVSEQVSFFKTKTFSRTVPPMCGGRYSRPMKLWISLLETNFSLLMASGPSHVFTIFQAAAMGTTNNKLKELAYFNDNISLLHWRQQTTESEKLRHTHHSWSTASHTWSFWLNIYRKEKKINYRSQHLIFKIIHLKYLPKLVLHSIEIDRITLRGGSQNWKWVCVNCVDWELKGLVEWDVFCGALTT